jgi:hypothetical protein
MESTGNNYSCAPSHSRAPVAAMQGAAVGGPTECAFCSLCVSVWFVSPSEDFTESSDCLVTQVQRDTYRDIAKTKLSRRQGQVRLAAESSHWSEPCGYFSQCV